MAVSTNGNTSGTGFLLGAITRATGGTVDFTPGSATTGNINTTNSATPFLGGWATVAGTNWAGIAAGGNIVALTSAGGSYTNDAWSSVNNTTVTQNDSISGQTTNSLRFNAAGPTAGGFSTTLSGTNTITSGGILVTAAAGASGATIAGGGTLTSGNGSDLIVNQFDSSGALTIGAQITGGVALTKSGPGAVSLTNSGNNYTGGTIVNGGVLSISSDGNLGSASASVILNAGTLQAAGLPGSSFALNASRGILLGPASGLGGGTIAVGATNTLTVNGAISNNGSSTSSLTKAGAGTLILVAPNPFSGGFNINQGTVVITNAHDTYNYGSTITSLGPDTGTVTFTGNATLQYSSPGPNNAFVDDSNFVINAGVTATIDNNAGAGGFGAWVSGFASTTTIKGQGGLNFVSSFGSPNSGSFYEMNEFYANAGDHSGINWTYSGPTTVYATCLEPTLATLNGVPYANTINNNVLNLGGSIQMYSSGGPGDPSPIQNLATQVNLIADTSSLIANDGMDSGSQVYVNSVSSNGIVRASGSTLNFAGTPDSGASASIFYVANGGIVNTAAGIIGGWCDL